MKELNLLPEHGLEENGILCSKQGLNQENCIWCFKLEWIQMEKGEMGRAGSTHGSDINMFKILVQTSERKVFLVTWA